MSTSRELTQQEIDSLDSFPIFGQDEELTRDVNYNNPNIDLAIDPMILFPQIQLSGPTLFHDLFNDENFVNEYKKHGATSDIISEIIMLGNRKGFEEIDMVRMFKKYIQIRNDTYASVPNIPPMNKENVLRVFEQILDKRLDYKNIQDQINQQQYNGGKKKKLRKSKKSRKSKKLRKSKKSKNKK